jgi:hypothetical protein
MLVIRPAEAGQGLWPPHFVIRDHQGAPAVHLATSDRNATIRFTTDGLHVGRDSLVYQDPILVESCREVRACSVRDAEVSSESVLRHLPAAVQPDPSLLHNGSFTQGTDHWRRVVAREMNDPVALLFTVERNPQLSERFAARLNVQSSDGVPYHLRLVQPLQVTATANLYVTATLVADRRTRVRFGIQERKAPFRVVQCDVLEIGTTLRRLRFTTTNPHTDLDAQLQLDLGYCAPGTTVWLSDVAVHLIGATK